MMRRLRGTGGKGVRLNDQMSLEGAAEDEKDYTWASTRLGTTVY